MKFYYEATHHRPYEEDDHSFLCSFERELTKGDYIVVYLHDDIGFAIAKIIKKVNEIDALSQPTRPVEIIQHAEMVISYKRKLENLIKINSLRLDLEEKAKEVKTRETYRKLASQSQEFRELFEVLERLEKGETEVSTDLL